MATHYLKKKKMHAILCDIFGITPKMTDTDYRFYRGTEWLQYSRGEQHYEICAENGGAYLFAESSKYDFERDRYVNTSRKVYNGFGKYTYPVTDEGLVKVG